MWLKGEEQMKFDNASKTETYQYQDTQHLEKKRD